MTVTFWVKLSDVCLLSSLSYRSHPFSNYHNIGTIHYSKLDRYFCIIRCTINCRTLKQTQLCHRHQILPHLSDIQLEYLFFLMVMNLHMSELFEIYTLQKGKNCNNLIMLGGIYDLIVIILWSWFSFVL